MAIRHYVYAAGIAASLALLAACGDEVTEVTNVSEKASLDQVKKFKELPKCDEDAEGSLVYVKDSAKVFSCSGKDWVQLNGKDGSDGKDGKNGSNGDDGASCTVKQNKAKTGLDIVCDGKKVGSVESGSDGKDGSDGDDGASCTVKQNKKKTGFDIVCGGKTVGTVSNGEEGKTGDGCSLEDNGAGQVTVKCGGETVTLAKAFCGSGTYDPATQFCVENKAYPKCNSKLENLVDGALHEDGTYNVNYYFCDVTDVLVDLCNGEAYDLTTEFCDFTVLPRCDSIAKGVEGDVALNGDPSSGTYNLNYFCHNGVIWNKCGGNSNAIPTSYGYEYDPETQFCSSKNPGDPSGRVADLCGKKKKEYDIEDSMCVNGKVQYAKACCDPGNQGENWCAGSAHIYDVRTHFCDAREKAEGRIYGYKDLTLTSAEGDTVYSKTWMTENVDYSIDNTSLCLGACSNGRFYTWSSAPSSCPDGWRLPDSSDYAELLDAFGTDGALYLESGATGFSAKTRGFVEYDIAEENAPYVFSADTAFFWTSTNRTVEGEEGYYFSVASSAGATGIGHMNPSLFLNVRCIRKTEN